MVNMAMWNEFSKQVENSLYHMHYAYGIHSSVATRG